MGFAPKRDVSVVEALGCGVADGVEVDFGVRVVGDVWFVTGDASDLGCALRLHSASTVVKSDGWCGRSWEICACQCHSGASQNGAITRRNSGQERSERVYIRYISKSDICGNTIQDQLRCARLR